MLGLCAPATLPHSTTACSGEWGSACRVACEEGYAPRGAHICRAPSAAHPEAHYEGGSCEPLACRRNTLVEHASTPCSGVTGEECALQCGPSTRPSPPPHVAGLRAGAGARDVGPRRMRALPRTSFSWPC